ncbi:hypothetical protein [Solwaraspora sp. WMMA2065]|uniref:hypothetical protein n=1 Tax=Solwaraspora sp. WMMA2065 TaxID=3015166 RepID=UPI00259B8961|nr:hypothetical protein [Solwaraspora sp. WMMA2065]WJK36783.1 hypothetical protein O7610_10785 [Solwaraspora sp. WMMA2065]
MPVRSQPAQARHRFQVRRHGAIRDQGGQLQLTGRHHPVTTQRTLQPDRFGQQRQPDPATDPVPFDGADDQTQAASQDPLVAVQQVDRGQPVGGGVAPVPVRIGEPEQRLATAGHVQRPLWCGGCQLGQRPQRGSDH